jgi:hypothetical protein
MRDIRKETATMKEEEENMMEGGTRVSCDALFAYAPGTPALCSSLQGGERRMDECQRVPLNFQQLPDWASQ